MFRWDGRARLDVEGEPWWGVESSHLDGLATVLLLHVTGDRALALDCAKRFAADVLGPLAGAPATILSSAVEAWLWAVETREPAAIAGGSDQALSCAGCGGPVAVADRHRGMIEVFGTTCDACHGAMAGRS